MTKNSDLDWAQHIKMDYAQNIRKDSNTAKKKDPLKILLKKRSQKNQLLINDMNEF